MTSHKIAVKFFVEDPAFPAGSELVPVFHSWIQSHAVADHLPIDVADYQHVKEGPGTLLITHEANFALDREGGRPGLLYVRKQPITDADTFADRLRAILRATLEAAARIEQDPRTADHAKFRTDEFLFRIYDRLLGPNEPATFAAVKADLESVVSELYGNPPRALEFTPDPQSLFEVLVKTGSSPSVETLLSRLSPATSR
ncbi:MAG TPA: hypothetical protein VG269_21240 [Tepidisphaeraceae bacterium]|jgi:uncharacterized protein (DUF2267 family)|nr:hypothetical protein [Tepidisphaeraceae bacterium]